MKQNFVAFFLVSVTHCIHSIPYHVLCLVRHQALAVQAVAVALVLDLAVAEAAALAAVEAAVVGPVVVDQVAAVVVRSS